MNPESTAPAPGAPFTMPIERGKIREFARATKLRDRVYFDDERPPVPPTFLMAAAFWQDGKSFAKGGPKDMRRVLHGEQEFVFFSAPPRAGDVLVGRQRFERSWEKAGKRGGTMTFYELVTEFRRDKEPVAETRMTLIETAAPKRDQQDQKEER